MDRFIDCDFYKEDPEIYDEELLEVCENLSCTKQDILFITSDDDLDFIEEVTDFDVGLLTYKGEKIYSIYSEGGLITVFSTKNLKNL